MRVAVEGCGHGTLNAIYSSLAVAARAKGWEDGKVDLLIIGGDFQAVRNVLDLECMAVPHKYRELGDFHEYYSGARTAPVLTLFVGGNHEASNHLLELFYGGWVAPNIYYMGAANVLRVGGLRIAGLSGIWKGFDYRKPHHERLPYSPDDVRSAYHVREIDVRRLLQVRTQVDVGISHDWPKGVEWMGDSDDLFRRKPFFRDDAQSGRLGSVAARTALDHLRPRYWFAAHLHVKYAATVHHSGSIERDQSGAPSADDTATAIINTDEIDLDLDMDDEASKDSLEQSSEQPAVKDKGKDEHEEKHSSNADNSIADSLPASFRRAAPPPAPPTDIQNATTQFLALDKCLPRRDFLQLLDIETSSVSATPPELQYDAEWLAINKTFSGKIALGDRNARDAPDLGRAQYLDAIRSNEQWVADNIPDLCVPRNFSVTAPVHAAADKTSEQVSSSVLREYRNPQTQQYCEMLDMPNPLALTDDQLQQRAQQVQQNRHHKGHFEGRGRGRGRGFDGRGRGRGRGRRPR